MPHPLKASEFAGFKSRALVMATAYDFFFARVMEAAEVDVILVGDSLANVVLGLDSTREVGMEAMELFVGAAARGAPNTHILADMPFGSDEEPALAIANARRFLARGAHSVKLEGPKFDVVSALVGEGISVIGHLGLLPQTAKSFKQVGRTDEEKAQVLEWADRLVAAGAIAVVLEHMDSDLAAAVTRRIPIPTIGIGAGAGVDGQVLVQHDLLGMNLKGLPPFARSFADVHAEALKGARGYADAVRSGRFP